MDNHFVLPGREDMPTVTQTRKHAVQQNGPNMTKDYMWDWMPKKQSNEYCECP